MLVRRYNLLGDEKKQDNSLKGKVVLVNIRLFRIWIGDSNTSVCCISMYGPRIDD